LHIVYLDQNKWIGLARAAQNPAAYPDLRDLLEVMTQKVRAGELALPLTATNIYETHKINDAKRRHDLASLQAFLSRGLVFRSRHKRLEVEIGQVLEHACGLPPNKMEALWFLSSVFFEAFAEWRDERLGFPISERVIDYICGRPAHCLYEYLCNTPSNIRVAAVKKFSEGLKLLRGRVEDRRRRHSNESIPLRRRMYSALLLIDEADLLVRAANKAGISCNTVADLGGAIVRRVMNDLPTYYVEREIALRLETQKRPVHENDFRDMQSFCAIIPYADEVVAEKQFASLAQQAKLNRKYHTRIMTDILELRKSLQQLRH
jgi:hypothetical protein